MLLFVHCVFSIECILYEWVAKKWKFACIWANNSSWSFLYMTTHMWLQLYCVARRRYCILYIIILHNTAYRLCSIREEDFFSKRSFVNYFCSWFAIIVAHENIVKRHQVPTYLYRKGNCCNIAVILNWAWSVSHNRGTTMTSDIDERTMAHAQFISILRLALPR